jgi:quercetin dioxygenase-like cupin family protein
MHKLGFLFIAVLLTITASPGSAQSGAKILTPDQLKWGPGGPQAKGVSVAPLAGTPNGTGWFVLRVKMNPGAHNPPHTHKTTEILEIISGTLNVGFGATVNRSRTRAVSAGSVVVIPAGVPHYTMATDTVQYDVSGMGPSTNIPIKKGSM